MGRNRPVPNRQVWNTPRYGLHGRYVESGSTSDASNGINRYLERNRLRSEFLQAFTGALTALGGHFAARLCEISIARGAERWAESGTLRATALMILAVDCGRGSVRRT